MNSNPIIHAIEIKSSGVGKVIPDDRLTEAMASSTLTWVHLDGTNPEAKQWLSKQNNLMDSIITDALLADETRPRIVEFESGFLLILRGINLNEHAKPEDMISIRLWVDAERIISAQQYDFKAIRDIQTRLNSGKGPKSSGEFLCHLIAGLFDRMEPIFSALDEHLDDTEERVMESPSTTERQAITRIRKQAISYRRYIAPQREVISALRTSNFTWLSQTHKRRLQESLDQIIRFVEDLDAIRERAQIIKDELANALADKLNKNMYLLSIVAAVFLPLGFFTGLLGINVGGLPGVDNNAAFLIVCLICVTFSIIILGLFKYLKWL
jgi:zinc transporter